MGKINLENSTSIENCNYKENQITISNECLTSVDIVYFHNGKAYNIEVAYGDVVKIEASMVICQHYNSSGEVSVGSYDETLDKHTGRFYEFSAGSTPYTCLFVPILSESKLLIYNTPGE